MKITVTLADFRDAFHRADRDSQFSYEGLEIIFDYMESYEQDTGEELELDVIAICCDVSEMTPEEILESYPSIGDAIGELPEDEEEALELVRDTLETETTVLGVTAGSILFHAF